MINYKILIIDDSVENLKAIVALFGELKPNYHTLQTNDPSHALNIAIETQPDLIISDWDMPQVSGLELINLLKNNSATKDIPIIIATGIMLSPQHLQTALDAGAVDYIRKPIEPTELIARSKAALLITDYHKALVLQKDQELTESSLFLVESKQYLATFDKKLANLESQISTKPELVKTELRKIRAEIKQRNNNKSWQRFELSFSKVHADFYKNLIQKHPTLSPTEIKISALIKLGMSNKEIATIMNQTPDSVKVSRYRLRKKLNLEKGENLENFLHTL